VKRAWFFAAALTAAVQGRTDQLLLMPTARHLSQGLVRAEGWIGSGSGAFFGSAGINQFLDAQISVDRFGSDPGRPTAAFAYYYLTPIADITPGISGGLLDVANATSDGRRAYACASLNRALHGLERFGYTEITAGIEVGRRAAPIGGVRLPIARAASLLGEYDGFRFNAGVELRFSAGSYARILARGGVLYAVLGFRG